MIDAQAALAQAKGALETVGQAVAEKIEERKLYGG